MRTRTFVVLGVLVALLVAGGVSFYASSSPDGLEHVAEQVGFAAAAREHPLGGGPLADYEVRGLEDDRLAGGLAGVAGALVVLLVTGGVALAVRGRGRAGRR